VNLGVFLLQLDSKVFRGGVDHFDSECGGREQSSVGIAGHLGIDGIFVDVCAGGTEGVVVADVITEVAEGGFLDVDHVVAVDLFRHLKQRKMHRPLRPLLPPPHPIRLRIRLGHPPGNRTILLVELRAEIVRIPRNAVALPKIVIGVDGAGEARSVFVGWVGEADVFVFSVLLVGVVFVAVFVFVVLVALVGGLAFVVVVVGLVGVGGLFGGRLFVVVIGIFVVVVVDVVVVGLFVVLVALLGGLFVVVFALVLVVLVAVVISLVVALLLTAVASVVIFTVVIIGCIFLILLPKSSIAFLSGSFSF